MKSWIVFLILILLITISTFSNKAQALSCVPTFPTIGTIDAVTKKESYTEILLDNVYTFNTSDFITDEIVSIDRYVNTVDAYIKNDFHLSEKLPSEYDEWGNKIPLSIKILDEIPLQKGDIIITGPQFHVCSYGFSGVFARTGELQHAVINDGYGDYSYGNSKLVIKAGKELECNENDTCKVEVDYKLDGKSFSLSPGQSYTSTGNLIKSITLLDSSEGKSFDWGIGTYVSHVISFQDSEMRPTPTPEPSPEPTPVEKLNIFQKIWRWFGSLFE